MTVLQVTVDGDGVLAVYDGKTTSSYFLGLTTVTGHRLEGHHGMSLGNGTEFRTDGVDVVVIIDIDIRCFLHFRETVHEKVVAQE